MRTHSHWSPNPTHVDNEPATNKAAKDVNLTFASINYRSIRDRILAQEPNIDEQTLADTVEGLTDLQEILEAIVRGVLVDEALAIGLKGRIAEMQDRLERLQDRASKRRQIA